MSSCEKCWHDAHRGPHCNVAEEYSRLMDERRGNPCTPEQQAGPDAKKCPECGRVSLHQWTGECMNCDYGAALTAEPRSAEAPPA